MPRHNGLRQLRRQAKHIHQQVKCEQWDRKCRANRNRLAEIAAECYALENDDDYDNNNLLELLHELDGARIDWHALAQGTPPFTIIPYTSKRYLRSLFGKEADDYRIFLKDRMITSGLAEELMANRFHPKHMDKWAAWGHIDEDEFA